MSIDCIWPRLFDKVVIKDSACAWSIDVTDPMFSITEESVCRLGVFGSGKLHSSLWPIQCLV